MKKRNARYMLMALTAVVCSTAGWAGDGPDRLFVKPAPITLAEIAKYPSKGVSAVEVNDYAPGRYTGPMTPSPPHADMNAKKAVVVYWKDHSQRFIFSHEASYMPFLELTNGAALCSQFFEGNLGDASFRLPFCPSIIDRQFRPCCSARQPCSCDRQRGACRQSAVPMNITQIICQVLPGRNLAAKAASVLKRHVFTESGGNS